MRVLITNMFLSSNSGTETVSAITAAGLRNAGHEVTLFAPRIGDLAQRMRTQGFPLYDRIGEIHEKPDVIHAHHLTPTLIAMTRFPDVPVVFTCHSSVFAVEAPMVHPQIKRWIAVDEACRRKSISCGVPEERLSLIHNAVDLMRFKPRDKLPLKPERGLLLTKNHEHQKVVREACQAMNITLDELGPATGRTSSEIEKELPNYDIVFATARMAIEAAAVGCAVVVCDARGFAGLLTSKNMAIWRDWNLGVGLLNKSTSVENIKEAIAAYDAEDTFRVMEYFRSVADLNDYISKYINVYQQAIDEKTQNGIEDYSFDNARWVEELAVTVPERKWFEIATELLMLKANNDHALMLARFDALSDELKKLTSLSCQSNKDADKKLSKLENFIEQARKFYRATVPVFIRKYLYNLRHRKN